MDKYAVIGHPIRHTLSPIIHNANFNYKNNNASYIALNVAPNHLKYIYDIANEYDLKGFNVTIPHKENIIPYLDELDDYAMAIDAVNTVSIRDNKWIGYNTDVSGYLKQYKDQFPQQRRKVLIIGAGGAAKAVSVAHININDEVSIVTRNSERFKNFPNKSLIHAYTFESLTDISDFDCIINASPVGLNGEDVFKLFKNEVQINDQSIGIDLIYSRRTPFLNYFKSSNATDGLKMLIYQAMDAYLIWTGEEADYNSIKAALNQKLLEERQ